MSDWQMVPTEPTAEMCSADWNVSMSAAHTDGGVSRAVWIAMLAAAPKPAGPWAASPDGRNIYNSEHDADLKLTVDGDWASDSDRADWANAFAASLNSKTPNVMWTAPRPLTGSG